MRFRISLIAVTLGVMTLFGCARSQPPAAMAPPMQQTGGMAPTMGGAPPQDAGVYNWQDVPQGQQIPVQRARFDQGGYQIYCATGETIVVPFVNQDMYVMKFGRSNTGQTYFVNEGTVPILYLRDGDFLENAAAQNARWYPIPQDYAYSRPIYVGLAPTWNDYMAMGWYPGMVTYGGLWGYSPGVRFVWMPSFSVHIGSNYYRSYDTYRTYYTRNPGYVRTRVVYNNYGTRSTGSWGSRRISGGSSTFRAGGGTGSFRPGVSGTSGFRSGGGFRPSSNGTGSFRPGSSMGGGGFSGSRPSGGSTSGSFSGNRGFGNAAPTSSGSFSGNRSFGGSSSGRSSFGGASSSGRSSFSGSSGSSGRSSFGGSSGGRSGSFGGRRR